MIGSLVALPLADGSGHQLHDELIDQAAIEVPIMPWPAAPRRLVRISAQRYNDLAQYERLAAALKAHA
jgi:isopenicillin-N epimerase